MADGWDWGGSPSGGGSASSTSGGGGGWDWGSGSGAAASPAAPPPPAPPKPAGHGGGGIFGFLGRAAGDVINAAKGIEDLPVSTAREVYDVGRVGLDKAGILGAPRSLQQQPHENPLSYFGRIAPVTGGLVSGVQQTGSHVVGLGQALSGGTLGHGFSDRLGSDYYQHPIGSLLNDVGNLSVIGHGLGAGLEHAGFQGAADAVHNAPGVPGRLVSRLGDTAVAQSAGDAFGRTGFGRGLADLRSSIADRAEAARARATIAPIEADTLRTPSRDFAGEIARDRLNASRLVRDPIEQGAAIANARGLLDVPGAAERMSSVLADPATRSVLADRLAERNRGLPDSLQVTPEHLETAARARLGLLDPEATARLHQGEQFVRGLSDARAPLARLQGVGEESFAGPVPMESKIAEMTAKEQAIADRTKAVLPELRDKADLARLRAEKEETIARGNTGQAGQEQAAFTAKAAAERAAKAQAEAGSKLGNIENRAATEVTSQINSFPKHLADVQAEQAGVTGPFDERVKANRAQAVDIGKARQAFERLPDAAPGERPALLEQIRKVTSEPPARIAADLDRLGHANAQELADLRLSDPRGTDPKALESARAAADASVEAQRAAESGIMDKAAQAHAEEQVRASRAIYKSMIRDRIAQIDHDLEVFNEGTPLKPGPVADAQHTAAGRLGPKPTEVGAYDDLRDVPANVQRVLDRTGYAQKDLLSNVNDDRLAPDDYLTQAHIRNAVGPDASLGDVAAHVQRLLEQRAELSRGLAPSAGNESLLRAATKIASSPEEIDHLQALFTGTPAEAARALAEHFDSPTHGMEALQRSYDRIDQYHNGEKIRLSPAEQQIADAERAQYRAATMPEGLPNPADVAEQRQMADRAAVQGRAGDMDPRLYPQQVGEAAGSVAQQHVADALATDAEAGSRVAYDKLTNEEKAIYRGQVGADYATATARQLTEARDRVLDTMAQRGRTAGQMEGQRIERANVAERAAKLGERRAAAAQDRLDKAVAAATDSLRAAPAAYRAPLSDLRDFAETFAKEGKARVEAGDTVGAQKMGEVAADLERMAHLPSFAESGVQQPAHLIGASKQAIARETLEEGPPSGRGPARATRAAATKERTGNLGSTTFDAVARDEIARRNQYFRTNFANAIHDQLGAKPDAFGVDTTDMNPREIGQAMRQVGAVPWSPTEGTLRDFTKIGPDTRFLPEKVAQAADARLNDAPLKPGPAGKVWDAATRVLYKTPLQMSPVYWAHRFGTDMATMLSHGMSLADIIKYGTQAAQDKIAGDIPGSLRGGLLDDARQNRLTSAATSVPRTIDELTSQAMYLKKLDELGGRATPENHIQAVRYANDALGKLNRLGPLEQAAVRRVFPVYPWIKQVASIAAGLAQNHPVATLFYLHAGEQAAARGDKGMPAWLQPFSPLHILTVQPGALVHPFLRAGAGEFGLNLAGHRDVTRPLGEPQGFGHALPASQGIHFAENQFLGGKLYNALRQNPVQRYDNGEPRLSKGTPAGGTPLPGGRLGAVKGALGLSSFKPAPPSKASERFKQSQAKSAATYQARLSRYRATTGTPAGSRLGGVIHTRTPRLAKAK